MARNRVIYNNQALSVCAVDATDSIPLTRIQSVNWSLDIPKQPINQYGQLDELDRIVVDPPTVSLDFEYFTTNGYNEAQLGFNTDGVTSAVANFLDKTQDEKNYFLATMNEGQDAIDGDYTTELSGVVGIGNGFLSSYSATGSVGELATSSVSVEGINVRFDVETNTPVNPAIDHTTGLSVGGTQTLGAAIKSDTDEPSAIRPGDITVEFDSNLQGQFGPKMGTADGAHIQSYSLDISLDREPQERMGTRLPFAREPSFPLEFSLTITANMNELNAGGIDNLICGASNKFDISVILRDCDPAGVGDRQFTYICKEVQLENMSSSGDIGSNETVEMTFTGQVGAEQNVDSGIFFLSGPLPTTTAA